MIVLYSGFKIDLQYFLVPNDASFKFGCKVTALKHIIQGLFVLLLSCFLDLWKKMEFL